MSKVIRIPPAQIQEMRDEFEKAIAENRIADGTFHFSKTFASTNEKATVYFTAEAWMKMWLLIRDFSKEVAWHGVASRLEAEGKHEYLISDIVVYPQEVTGTTVEMDTEKYAQWLYEHFAADDERFEHLYMQGHSHVNMGVTPSGTDLNHQREILADLKDDAFYIFMIYNKSMSRTIKIYDNLKNIMFEDKDISVGFYGCTENMDEFLKNAKEMVKERVYTSGQNYYGGGNYGGSYGGGTKNNVTPYNPVANKNNPTTAGTPTTPANTTTPATAQTTKPVASAPKQEEKPKTRISGQTSMYDDDDDNPYSGYPYRYYD